MNAREIIFLTRFLPAPGTSGSATHTIDLLRTLATAGYAVEIVCFSEPVHVSPAVRDVATVVFLAASTIEPGLGWYGLGDDLVSSGELFLFERYLESRHPKAMIVEYEWMAGLFSALPEGCPTKKIIFLHDLRTLILPSVQRGGIPVSSEWSAEKEAALLRLADVVLTLQDAEDAVVRRLAPWTRAMRIGISGITRPGRAQDQVPGNVVYVGSKLLENLVPLRWFIGEVWPTIREEVPHATLTICGAVGELVTEPPEGVVVAGKVENLDAYYSAAEVAIVPHILHGGMKLKFVDALLHGKAIVANPCGVEGFPKDIDAVVSIADTAPLFSKSVIRILKNDVHRKNMEHLALKYAEDRLSASECYANLLRYLAT